MPFVTRKMIDADGVEFVGTFFDPGNGALMAVSMAVDRYMNPADFTGVPSLAGEYRDMRLPAGQVPPVIAIGNTGTFQTDRYRVTRVSFAQDGKEMVCMAMTSIIGPQVFSNTGLAILGSMPARIDGRTNRITLERTTNANYLLPTSAATTNAAVAYTGPARLCRLQGWCKAGTMAVIRINDGSAVPTKATTAPLQFVVKGHATEDREFSIDLCDMVMVTGIALRITRNLASDDDVAIGAGDVYGLNLTYAR
ncbi:hypothetical protein [uncultured Sphingomonas sp.]|uniref:hypothetical protein n=1 Tax=uncultured Sphingomonas sp. TaxID=158754 RepID=UPI0025EF18E4|nr:hypothetical protein [uncultured Sphingomonas sp.]